MSFSESISPLVGRLMFSWFFLTQAFQYMRDWKAMVRLTDMKGVPAAPAVLALAILTMVFCGAALLIGFQTRVSAMLLAVCTMSWVFIFHNFWNVDGAVQRAADYQIFALGIAVTGGLLVLVGFGGGRFSFHPKRRA